MSVDTNFYEQILNFHFFVFSSNLTNMQRSVMPIEQLSTAIIFLQFAVLSKVK